MAADDNVINYAQANQESELTKEEKQQIAAHVKRLEGQLAGLPTSNKNVLISFLAGMLSLIAFIAALVEALGIKIEQLTFLGFLTVIVLIVFAIALLCLGVFSAILAAQESKRRSELVKAIAVYKDKLK